MPVTKADSSDAKKRHADATSETSVSLPSGTFDNNFALFSGVLGTPANDSKLRNVDNGASTLLLQQPRDDRRRAEEHTLYIYVEASVKLGLRHLE
ncbi:uncharacterized protein KY384_007405 [Bacidia gigantensis]|uniref:uncharacterized protein n=1 Tax=Bacidia gigantensis TaxID=2732470 RepID=UPI001D03E1A5|nr:uncharacterized protein KY384_007405 [Bacidia gigantensis]KAG8528487.1 hypothetical protein KY384_007405 [Bacidia gigantensis]